MVFIKFTQRGIVTVAISIVIVLIIFIMIMVLKSHRIETSDVIADTQNDIVVTGTICLDAGHGGSDVGAISTDGTVYEKDDNLKLALKVQEYLESMGLSVIMTRTDDSYIDLNERCRIANENNVDLFVSLHRNSAENVSARGVEIWVHNSKPPIDVDLAQNILDNLMNIPNQENRGIGYGYRGDSNENYRINKLTTMPSCLVETGFLSNDTDIELYTNHLDDLAKSIADGIYQTLEDIARGSVDTSRGKSGQNWD